MSEKEFLPVKSDVIFRLFFAYERNMDYCAIATTQHSLLCITMRSRESELLGF